MENGAPAGAARAGAVPSERNLIRAAAGRKAAEALHSVCTETLQAAPKRRSAPDARCPRRDRPTRYRIVTSETHPLSGPRGTSVALSGAVRVSVAGGVPFDGLPDSSHTAVER